MRGSAAYGRRRGALGACSLVAPRNVKRRVPRAALRSGSESRLRAPRRRPHATEPGDDERGGRQNPSRTNARAFEGFCCDVSSRRACARRRCASSQRAMLRLGGGEGVGVAPVGGDGGPVSATPSRSAVRLSVRDVSRYAARRASRSAEGPPSPPTGRHPHTFTATAHHRIRPYISVAPRFTNNRARRIRNGPSAPDRGCISRASWHTTCFPDCDAVHRSLLA